jgi:hypothetical protein
MEDQLGHFSPLFIHDCVDGRVDKSVIAIVEDSYIVGVNNNDHDDS